MLPGKILAVLEIGPEIPVQEFDTVFRGGPLRRQQIVLFPLRNLPFHQADDVFAERIDPFFYVYFTLFLDSRQFTLYILQEKKKIQL